MDIPSEKQQFSDFKAWERELTQSENTIDDESYIAPRPVVRIGRFLKYWLFDHNQIMVPAVECFPAPEQSIFNDPILEHKDPDDEEPPQR